MLKMFPFINIQIMLSIWEIYFMIISLLIKDWKMMMALLVTLFEALMMSLMVALMMTDGLIWMTIESTKMIE